MNSQRIVNIVSVAAIVAVVSALVIWRQTGDPAPAWLRTSAVALCIVAVIGSLIGEQTRPRLMLRFLSALFALLAVLAVTADWSRPAGDGTSGAISLLEYLSVFTPSMIASAKSSIGSSLGAAAWDPVMTTILGLPAWLIFAVVAVIAGYAGRPRRAVRIFIN